MRTPGWAACPPAGRTLLCGVSHCTGGGGGRTAGASAVFSSAEFSSAWIGVVSRLDKHFLEANHAVHFFKCLACLLR